MKDIELLPCPFCGLLPKIGISDDEGNCRNEEYKDDPWSGLTFRILHEEDKNVECPIATHSGDDSSMGVFLYDNKEEAIKAWNTRIPSFTLDQIRKIAYSSRSVYERMGEIKELLKGGSQ